MTWLRVFPSRRTVTAVVAKYADMAQGLFMDRFARGVAPATPSFVNQKGLSADFFPPLLSISNLILFTL